MSREIDLSNLEGLSKDDLKYLRDRGRMIPELALLAPSVSEEEEGEDEAPEGVGLEDLIKLEAEDRAKAINAMKKDSVIGHIEAFNEEYIGEDEDEVSTEGNVKGLRQSLLNELSAFDEEAEEED